MISVILPIYNSELYLIDALESLKNQTYKNFEVIIIDNCSNDNSIKLCKKYDNCFQTKILSTNNFGIIAKSRNLGIKYANGSIISFLDSDDYWEKNKLLEVSNFFSKYNIDVFCHNEIAVSIKNKYIKRLKYGPDSKNLYKKLLMFGNRLSTSAVSINKSFLIENNLFFSENKNFNTAEDYELWLNLAKFNARFNFCNKYLGYYRVDPNSNSLKNIKYHHVNVRNVLNYHLENLSNNHLKKICHARLQLSELKFDLKSKNIEYFFHNLKKLNFTQFLYIIYFIIFKLSKF